MQQNRNTGIAPPLVIRFGAMGDMVVLTALLRTLHARFGSRVDLVLTERRLRPLLGAQPWIGALYCVSTRKIPYWLNPQLWQLTVRLHARGTGPVWICQTDDFTHELADRAGYDSQWWVSQRDYPMSAGEHCTDRLLRMARGTPRALSPSLPMPSTLSSRNSPRLVVPAAWHEEAGQWLAVRGLTDRPLVLIQAGNKRTTRLAPRRRRRNRKYWPERSWAVVVDHIHDVAPEAAVLLLGVRLECPLNRAILAHTASNTALDVAGDVPLTILAALCAQALGMISVDTGPAHIAAAVGCPLVVLFGDQDPCYIAPRSEHSPVEIVTGSARGERPMLAITPDAVIAAWQRLRSTNESAHRREPEQQYAT
jgi:heptosyltransferase III